MGSWTHVEGFTLIELSIVLVTIGLIVGGVLVGQDLVRAAGVRATISQVEKYQSAVNTFRSKYGALPGDLTSATAKQFGFSARGAWPGQGDGNGIIEGNCGGNCGPCGFCVAQGETIAFWNDITYANGSNINLIEGSFNAATAASGTPASSGTAIDKYLPAAKIGRGSYLYVWSGGANGGWLSLGNGVNYFGISAVTLLSNWSLTSVPSLTVLEASSIDRKIDDGLPQSGRVWAWYYNFAIDNFHPVWAAGPTGMGDNNAYNPWTDATTGSSTTCYDNSTSPNGQIAANGNPHHYSLEINNGSGINCALSFQFQ